MALGDTPSISIRQRERIDKDISQCVDSVVGR